MMTKRSRLLSYSLLIILLYGALRALVYDSMKNNSFDDWVARDSVMDIPRTLCFVLTLYICKRHLSWAELGVHWQGKWGAFFLLVAFSLISLKSRSFQFFTGDIGDSQIAMLIISSFVVGFFEEFLFRGLAYIALSKQYSPTAAIWISSLIFMIYHVQAQPYYHFPELFAYGLVYAGARSIGISIVWLSLLHGIDDSLVLLLARPYPGFNMAYYEKIFYLVVVFLLLLASRKRKRTHLT
ncbi:MAG: CPBP family intramembrane metalloprotease [Bdellovibrionaceae bacterium]|nr:CPBP family intramembrane metalloprotease [Bdellovibrionales bacterium]MCB9083603.1 CPBP family intramembrane metalloprotease [Pseudobdellovibrionaceae bacterium]